MAFSRARWKADRLPVREAGAVALLYLVLSIGVTWPLAFRLSTLLGAPFGEGDPYLNLWVLGWDLRVLFESPADFFSGRVFDAPIFHPARQTLAYTDHLLLQALIVSPVYAVTRDVVTCYNVLWIGSLWASAVTMWWYLREVTAHRLAAIVGGLAWAFSAYRLAHVVHLQLQALYFLPLAALAVHRIVARRRTRDGAWLGIWYGLTAVSSVYYAVIGGLGLLALGLGLVAGAGRSRLGRLARPCAAAAVVSAVLVLPVVIPYAQVQAREGFARTLDEAARHAASMGSYVNDPPWRSVALAPTGRTEEDALRPGWGALLLAMLALGSLRTRVRRPHVWGWLAVVIVGLVLSFGPDGARSVYAWCHRWIFGFHAVRAPARFGMLVAFGTAALAAYGAADALARPRRDLIRLLGLAGMVLLGMESVAWRLPAVAAPRLETDVSVWLRDEPGPGAVAHVPLPVDRAATPAMLGTLVHGRPLVNGYSGQRPSFHGAVEGALATFPSADALWTLHDLAVRFIVAPTPGLEADWPLVARATVANEAGQAVHIYELANEERLLASLGDVAAATPPSPGVPLFRAGERAHYDVFWDGAGATVAAGTIVLAIDAADPADPLLPPSTTPEDRARLVWRAQVRLETAPWVGRFFEGRDVFTTWADADLLPVWHRRELREGRRHVDRAMVFERDGGVATMLADTGDERATGLRVRVPPAVRDPLTALLLLRSVEHGDDLRVPINDMGRALTLEVGPLTAETMEWQGAPAAVWRVQPTVVPRLARRTPPTISVWLGRAHGLRPLRAEVDAGFGRVRLELARVEGE